MLPPTLLPSRRHERRAAGRYAVLAVPAAISVALAGCTSDRSSAGEDGSPGRADDPPAELRAEVRAPEEMTVVVEGEGAGGLAVAASETLFEEAPVVLLAPEGDVAAQAVAASASVAMGMPLLVTPTPAAPAEGGSSVPAPPAGERLEDELARLAPRAVVAFGEAAVRWAEGLTGAPPIVPGPAPSGGAAALEALGGLDVGEPQAVTADGLVAATASLSRPRPALLTLEGPRAGAAAGRDADDEGAGDEGAGDVDGGAALPDVAAADPLDSLVVLVGREPAAVAAAATARASGARVVPVAGRDPRADAEAIAALAEQPPDQVVAFGTGFGPAERLRQRVDVAATGAQLPGGGQVVFPGRYMTALYGHPGTPAMGVLGEQGVDESIARAQRLAANYQRLLDEPVLPAFEVIATVASGSPGPDGNYSSEADVAQLRPWVDAAGENGAYVVLDLQPGRTDFLTQARRYEELLAEPHVGLALDPEWRIGPDQRHLEQIGSVAAAEVNSVVTWLADFTRDRRLPQKLLLLHQFQVRMISDRTQVDTSRDELAVLVHADGFGTAGQKFTTWDNLHRDPPPNVWWGWKNFHDEDQPMFTPAQTVAVEPTPRFVSYQ